MTLNCGLCLKVDPIFFGVEVVELLKVMSFEKFLGLEATSLLSEWQVKSV